MKITSPPTRFVGSCWLLLAGLTWLLVWPGTGQAQPRKPLPPWDQLSKRIDRAGKGYVELPFSGDLESLLREHLGLAQGHKDFEELLRKMMLEPNQFQASPELFKKIDVNNPLIRKQLQNLLGDAQIQQQFATDPLKKKVLADLQRKLESPEDPEFPKLPDSPLKLPDNQRPIPDPQRIPNPEGALPPPQDFKPFPPVEDGFEQKLAEWMKDFLEDLEDSNLHKLLEDSPAFQGAIQDFQQLMEKGDWGWDPNLGQWANRLKTPDWLQGKMDTSWFQVPEMTLPQWQMPQVNLPRFNLGFNAPRIRPVSMPGLPTVNVGSTSGLSYLLLGLLVLAVVGLLIWQFRLTLAERAARLRNAWRLGPWPVDPRAVRTRRELVLAFNHVALLLLGSDAQHCNHREVTRQLRERPGTPDHAAVEALAALYEQARYAPDEEELSVEGISVAREHLSALAGVAQA